MNVAPAIDDLTSGRPARLVVHGNSMLPRIRSGSTVDIEPVAVAELEVDEVVLCRVRGRVVVHRVSALRGGADSREVQISNQRGHVNGWTRTVYGRVVAVEAP